MGVGQLAQFVLRESRSLLRDISAARKLCLGHLSGSFALGCARALDLEPAHFASQALHLAVEVFGGLLSALRCRAQRRQHLLERGPNGLMELQSAGPRHRLDASHARRDAALEDDGKEADVAGSAAVRAAAELHAEAR